MFCSFNCEGQLFFLRIFHNHAVMNHVSCKPTNFVFSILEYKIAQIPVMWQGFFLFCNSFHSFYSLILSCILYTCLLSQHWWFTYHRLFAPTFWLKRVSLQYWRTGFIRPPFPHHPHHPPQLLQHFNWLRLGKPSTPDVFPAGSQSKISVSH